MANASKIKMLIESGVTHVRYNNRKYYRLADNTYSSVDEIYQDYRGNAHIKVIRREDGKNITTETLSSGFARSGLVVKGINA